METTRMIETLRNLRASMDKPPSNMELIRRAVMEQAARANGIPMPAILNEDQRKVFADRADMLTEFLESEDGADAVELMVEAFNSFVEERQAAASEKPHAGD